MKFSLQRLLTIIASITAVAFVIAFILRHAKHGVALAVADAAWDTFIVGFVLSALVGLVTLAKLAHERRTARQVAR
jgi:uncharacterized integral membrane protein